MTEHNTTMLFKVTQHLNVIEKVFLAGLALGAVLNYLNVVNQVIIQISLLGLAITYFLMAFRIIEIPQPDDEKFEFKDFLARSIAPKVIWISCGVSLFGLFIYTLQLGHKGHLQAFLVGSSTIAIGLVIIAYAFLTGTKRLRYVLPTILRAIPLLITDFYFLFIDSAG